ncbi:hypothetical protein [Ilumatobacter sp.]|uniref:hypothetical protein n=1 Tax=Ilumatobacter sp. TaxID=1967498 RepID=UPI003750D6E7
MTADLDYVIFSWDSGEVRRDGHQFVMERNAQQSSFASLTLLLESLGDTVDEHGDTGSWEGIEVFAAEQLCAAADELSLEELFPFSSGGWVKLNGFWFPEAGVPDRDGDPSSVFELVRSFGNYGVSVDLYEGSGVYSCSWSGPENETSGFDVYGRISQEDAIKRASERAFDEMSDWDLLFDESGGLKNLSEEVPVPSQAVVIQRRRTWLHTGDGVVDVDIHRASDGPLWVTAHGLPSAIGRFDSLAAINAAWTGGDDHESESEIEDL